MQCGVDVLKCAAVGRTHKQPAVRERQQRALRESLVHVPVRKERGTREQKHQVLVQARRAAEAHARDQLLDARKGMNVELLGGAHHLDNDTSDGEVRALTDHGR